MALAREAIKDALFTRLAGCHSWERPTDQIKSTPGMIYPTFMLTKVEETATYPQTFGPPGWMLTFGMVVFVGPKDDLDVILGMIERCLESTATEERQWQTTLGGLVTSARIASVEIYQTEGQPTREAVIMIDVAANTHP